MTPALGGPRRRFIVESDQRTRKPADANEDTPLDDAAAE